LQGSAIYIYVNIRNITFQYDVFCCHMLFKIRKKLNITNTHAENKNEKLLTILKLLELSAKTFIIT